MLAVVLLRVLCVQLQLLKTKNVFSLFFTKANECDTPPFVPEIGSE